MFQRLPSLKALHAFEAAARHCSFLRAAEELALSPGAISYQIKQLENSLGTRLFERNIRQIALTRCGDHLFRTVHRQFRELETTIAQIAPDPALQTLTVSVSTYFVTRWLSQRLGKFITTHPNIVILLQHSVNDPNFRVEHSDIAIKWGNGQWDASRSELLLALPMMVVCAPRLTKGSNAIATIDDLQNQTLLRDQAPADHWNEWLAKAGANQVAVTGPVIVDPNVRVQSAIDGLGLVLANPLVNDLIDNRQLCEPFKTRLDGYGYYLVYSEGVSDNPALKSFKNWLQQETGKFN